MLPGGVRLSITESDRPVGQDLAKLEERRDLIRSFPPASTDQRKAMIARLFLRWAGADKISEETVACYAMDLGSFPMWAISKGIADIIGGLVLKSPEYKPSSLQVRAAVEVQMKPYRDELAMIDTILSADVIKDEEAMLPVGRRKQLADEVRAIIRDSVVVEPQRAHKPHPKLPSAFDDAHKADPSTPVTASRELREKIG